MRFAMARLAGGHYGPQGRTRNVMQRSNSAMSRALLQLTVALAWGLGLVTQAQAGTAESIAQAREALVADDARAAARLLEDALFTATKEDRPAILSLLRRAYESAARQAEAAGRAREAEGYRVNLSILDRKPGEPIAARPRARASTTGFAGSANAPAPANSANAVAPSAPEPLAAAPDAAGREEPLAKEDDPLPPRQAPVVRAAMPSQPPAALDRIPAEDPAASAIAAPAEPKASVTLEAPRAVAPHDEAKPGTLALGGTTPASAGSSGIPLAAPTSEYSGSTALANRAAPAIDVAAADEAFRAKHYDEAGRIYGALAQQSRLPDSRREHWAYCRCADVVRRINASPRTPADWASIREEVDQICALSPKMWYGDYLRRLINERSGAQTRQGQGQGDGSVVVRGAAPEEPPAPIGAPVRRPAAPRAEPQPTAAASSSDPAKPGPAFGNWQTIDTPNFRIMHADPALADRVARVAELTRSDQTLRWSGSPARGSWKPKCDIYLYPHAELFSQMTEQPKDSPGFSTMGLEGGRIVARRINLRADHQNLLVAVLPHEVSHVVLADLFPTQQIPRWADEGMAALAEPASEQHLRAADLSGALSSGKLFRLDELMTMDYPAGKHWALYFAQSVSLTRYLVERGTPTQFIAFLRAAQHGSVEEALRAYYQIESVPELQRRWLAHARSTPAILATSPEASPRPPGAVRRQ